MLQRTSTTLVLILLAACQSTPVGPQAQGEWRAEIEESQSDLMREMQGIRSLLDAQALDGVAMAIAGVGSSAQAVGDMELTSALTALSDRVEILTASMSTARAAGLADEARASDASATVDAAFLAGVVPLREALIVLERRCVIHCENIANASVPGYKRRRLVSMSTQQEQSGLRLQAAAGAECGMAAGVLERTGGKLDLAIHGEGFFIVQLPGGEWRYTRNGRFRQDVNGRLATAEGYLLDGDVIVPPSAMGLSVSDDGQVYALEASNALTQIGTIHLYIFPNAAALEPVDAKYFAATESSGEPMARQADRAGAGRIKQGYIERSNVDTTTELIDLQLVERQVIAVRRALASYGIYTGK